MYEKGKQVDFMQPPFGAGVGVGRGGGGLGTDWVQPYLTKKVPLSIVYLPSTNGTLFTHLES